MKVIIDLCKESYFKEYLLTSYIWFISYVYKIQKSLTVAILSYFVKSQIVVAVVLTTSYLNTLTPTYI